MVAGSESAMFDQDNTPGNLPHNMHLLSHLTPMLISDTRAVYLEQCNDIRHVESSEMALVAKGLQCSCDTNPLVKIYSKVMSDYSV